VPVFSTSPLHRHILDLQPITRVVSDTRSCISVVHGSVACPYQRRIGCGKVAINYRVWTS